MFKLKMYEESIKLTKVYVSIKHIWLYEYSDLVFQSYQKYVIVINCSVIEM